MSTDRSLVIWEIYAGATNDIDRMAEEAGGWVCEQHPNLEWPHGNCAGLGMLRSDAVDPKPNEEDDPETTHGGWYD